MDETGELSLPADESLNDLANVEPSAEESAVGEAEAQAGPLGEEVADLELDSKTD